MRIFLAKYATKKSLIWSKYATKIYKNFNEKIYLSIPLIDLDYISEPYIKYK